MGTMFGLVILAFVIDDCVTKLLKQWQGRPRDKYPLTLVWENGQWRAQWGEGVSKITGYGDSPEKALIAFDKQWMEG